MINICLVGYGYWGPNLARNFSEIEDCELVSIADKNDERLKIAKSKHPTVDVTTDHRDIIHNPTVDAVAIATPVSTHYQLAKEALEAGKHVLVEKPLTASVAEAEQLIEIAGRRSLTLMVDHVFVYNGAVRKIKEIIDSGEMGDIYYFDSVRINLGLFQHDINVVWDLAPHDFSIMDYLIDEKPISVSAIGSCHINTELENIAYITVKFAGGTIVHVHVNWLSPVKIRQTIIGGSSKMLVYDDLAPDEKIKVYDRGVELMDAAKEDIYKALVNYRTGDMYAPTFDRAEPLKVLCEHFIDCIEHGKTPITNGIAGLNVVRVLEAAQKSIKNDGMVVRL